jgi:hypothetical protein
MLFALLFALSLAAATQAAALVVCDCFLSYGFVKFNNLFQKFIQVGATSSTPGEVFQFIPPSVNATNGTVINFQFTGV